jgi:hypothetical protein
VAVVVDDVDAGEEENSALDIAAVEISTGLPAEAAGEAASEAAINAVSPADKDSAAEG